MEAESYVCPNCGAFMVFDSESQMMICENCDTSLNVSDVNRRHEEIKDEFCDTPDIEDSVSGEFEDAGQTGDFKVYRCSGCGAEILTDENTAATFCSFCGRPSLVEDRLTGELLPAYVIPFKINKEEATEIYKDWTRKGLLTPSKLKSKATIEKITGIYVPFWLYDYRARMNMVADATRERHEVRGDYRYTHTDHFEVVRDVEADYIKVPADASENMPDAIMDKLEPFMYAGLKEFNMPYLSGYYAEKYDYTSDEMASRVERRVRNYIYDLTKSTINGYSSVHVKNQRTNLNRLKAKYTMLPVWMLNYTYKGKQAMFAINGQTGKVVAERPISWLKALAWFLGITGISFCALFLTGRFL